MTWTAPEVTREEGPLAGGERPMLQAFLNWQRATLLNKCAGLTGAQLGFAQPNLTNDNLPGTNVARRIIFGGKFTF